MRLSKNYTLPLVASITLFTACIDCGYEYSYEVLNTTNTDVQISWTQKFESPDSLTLEPGEAEVLFTSFHGIEPCRDIPIFRDVNYDLESFKVVKMDSTNLESNLNYLSNDSWEFIDGTYHATINAIEF